MAVHGVDDDVVHPENIGKRTKKQNNATDINNKTRQS